MIEKTIRNISNYGGSKLFDYEAYYRKTSPLYDQIRLDHQSDFENTINIIIGQCGTKTKNILDIGCGTGRYGKSLADRGFLVVGLDRSSDQLEQAKKIIQTVQGDATSLPFANNSFDVCTMILMLHHLSNEERLKAFSEVDRVLRDGGVLVIKTCSTEDLSHRLTSIFFPELFELDSKRYPEIATIVYELSEYFSVSLVSSKIFISTDKEETIHKFSMRKSSNLGTLSDEQLSNGIAKMSAFYACSKTIDRYSYNTFVIGRKTNERQHNSCNSR